MPVRWGLDIRSFSSQLARESLHGQLLILHTLAQLPAGVELTWRLTVEPTQHPEADGSAHNEITAGLTLYCHVPADCEVSDAGVEELESLASVMLAAGHSLSKASSPRAPLARSRRTLRPQHFNLLPPVKPDWSTLVDLLRHRGRETYVDISCRSTGENFEPDGSTTLTDASSLAFDTGVSYLAGLSTLTSGRGLTLSIEVGTPRTADPALLDIIGNLVLGAPVVAARPADARKAPVQPLSPEVALRVWHSPYGPLQGRGLMASPPSISSNRDMSSGVGAIVGTTSVQGPDWARPSPVRLDAEERLRHVYIVGKTGIGKTNLIKRIAEQDIQDGHGVAVLSPHGDLIDHLLTACENRVDEVTYLDFGDQHYVPVLNPLTLDTETDVDFNTTLARVIDTFARRTFNQFTGPVFVDSVRLAVESVAAMGPVAGDRPTLAAAIELIRSDKLQRWVSKTLKPTRPDLAEEWERVFNMRGSEASETSRWVTAKFADLGVNSRMRAITTDIERTPLSLRRIYREGQILLVKLPDTHMPSYSSALLGNMLFGSLYREAQILPAPDAKPFFVHIDEFQRFVNSDLEELVAEARKFKLGLTFAHQNLRQLEAFSTYEGGSNPRLAEAIFSNVGTMFTMKTSGRDVVPFAQELGVKEHEVRGLVRGQCILRTSRDGEDAVCTVRVELAKPQKNKVAQAIRRRMIRDGYWRLAETQHGGADAMVAAFRAASSTSAARESETGSTAPSSHTPPTGTPPTDTGSFLDQWLESRKEREESRDDLSTGTSHSDSTPSITPPRRSQHEAHDPHP